MAHLRRTLALVSTLAVVFVGSALTDTASATHIGCGAVITQNTTLHNDIGPCPGDGLTIAASNITLNLNGRRVFANAPLPRMTPEGQPLDVVGIFLDDVTNVTVRNGTVHGFAAGVAIDFGGSNRITGITARDNRGACIGEDFTNQAVGTYGDGIVLFSSTNNRIENNNVLRNGPFSGVSIVANTFLVNQIVGPEPTGNIVRNNNIDNNRSCFADIGIRIEGPGASNNVVQSNRVSRSFQEGIAISSVINIDFSGLFRNPPTCQNRGVAGIPPVPHPELPVCPALTGENVAVPNSNNVIANNQITANGFGGPQDAPAGNTAPFSAQAASGLAMIAFCQGTQATGPWTIHGGGNVVQANMVTGNAGSGIWVGGCPPPNLPQFAPTPGFHDSRIVNNLSVRNNQARCGTLPPTPGCGAGRPSTPNFDLLDTSNVITCPSTSAGTQSICAAQGFGAPPAGTFVGTRVVIAGYPACDNNFWFGNAYGTAAPPCTTNGGRQMSSAANAANAATALSPAPGTATEALSSASARPVGSGVASQAQRGHRAGH